MTHDSLPVIPEKNRLRLAVSARFVPILLIVWPLLLATAVLIRQSHPFRVKSDDHAYYQLAKNNAAAARDSAKIGGFHEGFKAFRDGCSIKNDLPAHVHRKRPVLIWVWSGVYLIAGNQGLVWTWRFLFLLLILSLFLLLGHLSSPLIAAVLAGIVAVAPATQGLLSWMACSTYLVSYPFLLLGTLILYKKRGRLNTLAGLALLIVALLSREVAFLIVFGAISLLLYQEGRRYLAIIIPILAILTWFSIPGQGRSALGTFQEDPTIFIRGAFLVAAAELSSIVRNLGLLILIPLTVLLSRELRVMGIIIALCAIFFVPVQWILPLIIAAFSVRYSRRRIFGFVWMLVVIAAMCLYGHFSSRYAFEPLLGLVLTLAPALVHFRKRIIYFLSPFIVWFTVVSLVPDMVYSSSVVRDASNYVDQRFRSLHSVTSLRHREYCSFAGRVDGGWVHRDDLRISTERGSKTRGFVWVSPDFMRGGNAPNLHCRIMDHVVFNTEKIWEWNVWYWRIIPGKKNRGIHVDLPGNTWDVHSVNNVTNHDRCMFITLNTRPVIINKRINAERFWLADTPELNNPGRTRSWLRKIWKTEKGCHADLEASSFQILELGRLLIRDDGWLDLLELHYLESMERS